jgi:hypothetical protein
MSKVYSYLLNSHLVFLNAIQLKRLLLLCYGICQAKTVNISSIDKEIDSSMSGCKATAQYKWLMMAFQTGNITPLMRQIFTWVLGLYYRGSGQVRILIDRTNWDIGQRRVNILSIGILHDDRVFIPLLHEDLGYKGNSDCATRLNLIKILLEWWSLLDIPLPVFEVVGDREFIGEAWLLELESLGITYVIRLKSNLQFHEWLAEEGMSERKIRVDNIMKDKHKIGVFSAEIVLGDLVITNLVSVLNDGNDKDKDRYIYLITNRKDIAESGNVYRKRWKIETCFKHLKTAGFNLEDMKLESPHKTDILMSLLSLVYAMTIYLGEEEKKSKISSK